MNKILFGLLVCASSLFATVQVEYGKNTITMIDGDEVYTYSKYQIITLYMDKDDLQYKIKLPGVSSESWIYRISKKDYIRIKRLMNNIE
jgi:hypothetical protein